jgi:hypothetical protein
MRASELLKGMKPNDKNRHADMTQDDGFNTPRRAQLYTLFSLIMTSRKKKKQLQTFK